MKNKICTNCGLKKSVLEFSKHKCEKDGLQSQCKKCNSQHFKENYLNNPEKEKQQRKQWAINNPEKRKEISRKHRLKNIDRINQDNKRYRLENPEKVKESKRLCRIKLINPIRRLNSSISGAICLSLRGNKAGRHWETLVGYKLEDLKYSIESKFSKGMNWENYGEWQLDHYFPMSKLIIDSAEDPTFKYCWSLNNLQPLWENDNFIKHDMYPWEWEEFKKEHPERLYKPQNKIN